MKPHEKRKQLERARKAPLFPAMPCTPYSRPYGVTLWEWLGDELRFILWGATH